MKSRIDGVDTSLLAKMRRVGIDAIQFGVESISDQSLKRINKGGTVTKILIESVLRKTLEANIRINPVFIFGIPGQKKEELIETLNFIKKLGKFPEVLAYVSFYTPHPRRDHFPLEPDILLLENDLNRFTHKQMVAVPLTLSDEDGRRCLIDTYDEIAKVSRSRHLNPPLEPEYSKSLIYKPSLQDDGIPLYK